MSLDLIAVQLSHNAWAIGAILDRCRAISQADFNRAFEIGPGSLRRALAHLIDSMDFFAAAFAARTYTQRINPDDATLTPAALTDALARADRELHEAVMAFTRRGEISAAIEFPAKSGQKRPASVVLANVFDHGSHHRAQCLNMLRRLGKLDKLAVGTLVWPGLGTRDTEA